jgi:hypothetical protein
MPFLEANSGANIPEATADCILHKQDNKRAS